MTRIQWSGRQIIQAFITDITERKQAEHALREANRELRREIEQRTRAEESLKERVRMSTLNTEVALALNAGTELQAMLQQCCRIGGAAPGRCLRPHLDSQRSNANPGTSGQCRLLHAPGWTPQPREGGAV